MKPAVLFVDDDSANLVVCEAACGGDFRVLTAQSAEQALALMRQHEVGVLVSDQRMPGATGVDLLERIKIDFPESVRILITAYSDLPAAIDAINRGQIRRYLKKPWEPQELKAELRDALDVYTMQRKLGSVERRLREVERVYALGIVAAGIGHELRNPVGWLQTNLQTAQNDISSLDEMLAQPNWDRGRARAVVQGLGEAVEDALSGVHRIVDIVRSIEMPVRGDFSEPVDLAEVLRFTLRLVRGEMRDTASLEVDVQGAPIVRGSTTKLGQVVLNLLVNAIQALSGRPRTQNMVSVRIVSDERWAYLEVSDNGPGIDPESIDRIFDPFFTTKPEFGTGLGLAISRTIAEELGGRLEAANHDRGGALFRLVLPRIG